MMENNQAFIKKYVSKHRARCSCNLYIVRNEEFQIYLTKTVLKRMSNARPYSTCRKMT